MVQKIKIFPKNMNAPVTMDRSNADCRLHLIAQQKNPHNIAINFAARQAKSGMPNNKTGNCSYIKQNLLKGKLIETQK